MKSIKKKLFLGLLISLCCNGVYSQNMDMVKKAFITHLSQEGIMKIKEKDSNKYVDNFYYLDSIDIDLDSITSLPPLHNNIIFKYELGENQISINSNQLELEFNLSSCNGFILAVSDEGNSYRLRGFRGNDLLFLLRDIRSSLYEDRSYKQLVNDYHKFIKELDFKCIYESLLSQNLDAECLKSCANSKPSHLSR